MSASAPPTQHADLVIIGGGVFGLSIAYHYARLEAGRVLLLERNVLATAATSRAAALLTRARAKTALMPLIAQTYYPTRLKLTLWSRPVFLGGQDLRKTHVEGGIFELLDEVIVE